MIVFEGDTVADVLETLKGYPPDKKLYVPVLNEQSGAWELQPAGIIAENGNLVVRASILYTENAQ